MEPFVKLKGLAAPLDIAKVDTGMIISNRFTRLPRRPGRDYARAFLHDLRFDKAGEPIADFVLNLPQYSGARILVTGDDFGCGSSREGAAIAALDFGIRALIGPSFGDIFRENCMQNGIVPVVLPPADVGTLMRQASTAGTMFEVDLPSQSVTDANGKTYRFDINPTRKQRLLEGLDDVSATLVHEPEIERFEKAYVEAGHARTLLLHDASPGGVASR